MLQQLLTEDSLWNLPSTVQQLCHVSLTCKGLNSAVQQQGWPRLCRLLAPLRPQPPSTQGRQLTRWDPVQKGQPPANPDLLVTDPASLRVPELKAACTYYGLSSSGERASTWQGPETTVWPWCQLQMHAQEAGVCINTHARPDIMYLLYMTWDWRTATMCN